MLDGTDAELEASWPDMYFKDVVQQTMIDTGVVKKNSDTTHNPNRRLMSEQDSLGAFMCEMVRLWLRARAFHAAEPLAEWVAELAAKAATIQDASRNALQASWRFLFSPSAAGVSKRHRTVSLLILSKDFHHLIC